MHPRAPAAHRVIALAVGFAVLLALAGCGADADGGATDDDPPTPVATGRAAPPPTTGTGDALRCVTAVVAFEWALAQPHAFVAVPPGPAAVADYRRSLDHLAELVPSASGAELGVVTSRLLQVADAWETAVVGDATDAAVTAAATRTTELLEAVDLVAARRDVEDDLARTCGG
jgi:hypothetical protein